MDESLKMSEDLRNLSRKARRQSSVWIPEPKGQQFSYQAMRTDVHEKLGRQFFEDYREQIKHWNDSSANHAVFMRGPFLLKEGGRGRVGGIIVPLLEDDLGNDADKPVVQLISPKFDEKDVSAGWGGFAFLTRRDERITAQRGDVMFILIQFGAEERPDRAEAKQRQVEGNEITNFISGGGLHCRLFS